MSQNEVGQRKFWDQRADAWERRADSLDALSDEYGLPVMEALGVVHAEQVLDVGCGPGTTAIELAHRVSPDGDVLGVDISPAMVAAATRRAAAAGVTNARFVAADAQCDALGGPFDAAYSRFGVMFFSNPVKAFANIVRSLRPAGRLACAVWGPLSDNPWMFVPVLAAAEVLGAELTIPGPNDPGPFSLGEVERVREVLHEAGLTGVRVERVEGSRLITSGDAGDSVTTLLEVGPLGEAYDAADDRVRRLAIEAVLDAIEPYRQGDGWRLPGAALQVVASRS